MIKSKLVPYLKDALLIGLAVFLVWQWARPRPGPKVGTEAALFDLPLATGQGRFRIEDQRGSPVVMEIFASWCGSCRQSAPVLAGAFRKFHDKGVKFVGVSVDENANAARQAVAAWQIPYDVALDDGTVSRAYGVETIPMLVVIDRAGKVRHIEAGTPTESELSSWLADL